MKIITEIEPEIVARHLKANHSALSLPFDSKGYQAFHVAMDAGDERKIVLWWENEKATKDLNCRLVDSNDGAGNPARVDSFIHGDGKRLPADLRTLPNKEPVAVTDNLHGDFWYLIDGSHRSIAQFRSGKSFQDVKLYVCVHPQMMRWGNIPNYYKARRSIRSVRETMVAPASPYEQKFADFIRLLAESKESVVLIHHPQVIGDTYEEVVESLNRLANAGKQLAIVPQKER